MGIPYRFAGTSICSTNLYENEYFTEEKKPSIKSSKNIFSSSLFG